MDLINVGTSFLVPRVPNNITHAVKASNDSFDLS